MSDSDPRVSIEVCAAVVVRGDGSVLVARRVRPTELAGKWEFPGGKLEPGESPKKCLERELLEELALPVEVGEWLGDSERPPGPGPGLRLRSYGAVPVRESLEPTLVDGSHDAVRWVAPDELAALDWAPLDVPLVVGARAYACARRDGGGSKR